jgi:TRAP transporter 4TM/12TM fusion protein
MTTERAPAISDRTPGTANELDIAAEGDGGVRIPTNALHKSIVYLAGLLLTASCLAWGGGVPYFVGVAFYNEQFLAVVLGLALLLVYNAVGFGGKPHGRIAPLDLLFGLAGFIACCWIASEYPRLVQDAPYRTPEIMALSSVVILLVLEGLRRVTGWGLFGVVLFFIVYALVAHLMPIDIRGKPQDLGALVVYLGFDPTSIFGTPLVVGATIVIMYIWLGEVLNRAGGGEFFLDVAMALMGRRRGGPAKICVVGSAMFGTISGSSVSSVASVGVFTIPMMKRTGYSAPDAGGIEAVGATGGQLAPPVMGAAAFLMAEFIQVPYAEIALAAALPAVLYYLGLYWQVDLIAGRDNLAKMDIDLPRIGEVMREGWHFLLPFIVLLFIMFYWQTSPEVAAIGAAAAMFVAGMTRSYKGHRVMPVDLFHTLAGAGRNTGDLFMTLAGAGIVIGILNATGLAYALTLILVKIAGLNMFMLLFVAAAISIVLGMGMPTTAVYVLLAALIAPSLIETGVPKLAAHMFIFYFGMLSMITPPVALAAFAAANIAKAGVMETAISACRIGWVKFVLPVMFVLSPTLLLIGTPFEIVRDVVTAFIGVYYVTVGIVGFFQQKIGAIKRLLMVLIGSVALFPSDGLGKIISGLVPGLTLGPMALTLCTLVAVALGGAVLAFDYFSRRRDQGRGPVAPAAGAAE